MNRSSLLGVTGWFEPASPHAARARQAFERKASVQTLGFIAASSLRRFGVAHGLHAGGRILSEGPAVVYSHFVVRGRGSCPRGAAKRPGAIHSLVHAIDDPGASGSLWAIDSSWCSGRLDFSRLSLE